MNAELAASRLYFIRPEVFYGLFALIPVAALLAWHYVRRFPVILAFLFGSDAPNARGRRNSLCTELQVRYIASSVCFLLFCASIIAVFAGPRMGSRLVREFRRGCDTMFAIDVSRSMNARDSAPLPDAEGTNNAASRLERAVWLAHSLVAASEDSVIMASLAPGGASIHLRFGVAFGKGASVLAIPLTPDNEAIRGVLDALSPESMSSRGTNLEQLIDTAAGGFLENAPAGRQIILFSDGDGLSGSLTHAVERAKQRDITVIAVGVGSPAGVLVPENGEGGGDLVRTFLHIEGLKNVVEPAGGAYIDGNSDEALRSLAEAIFPLAGDSSWVFREEAGSPWHIFVIAALGFLALATALGLRSRAPALWKR